MLLAAVNLPKLPPCTYKLNFPQGWYTMLVVCLNVIAGGGGSNLYPPEQYAILTRQQINERITGSKVVVVSEQVSQKETVLTG
jgi:hypothetical protein